MTTYAQRIIKRLRPGLTDRQAAGIEGHMRSDYGTLDHLHEETFRESIKTGLRTERLYRGYLENQARSHGL